jgi:ATP-dependent RNA helicase RhlE
MPPLSGDAASPPRAATEAERRETTFDALHLHPELLKGIHNLGFIRPTPVQAQAIPAILSGRDVVACAPTGTGKTAAFVLPMLHRLLKGPSRAHLRALILAPTRELALQSMEHLRALSRYVHLKGAAIFGGVPMEPQIQALARGVDIVSATPGRLLDHIYAGRIDFGHLEVLVLDEVDRMLDMGFLPDIKNILRLLPANRQNLAFSATLPLEIVRLVHEILRHPVTIHVAQRAVTPVGIRHAVYPVPRHLKSALLIELLRGQGMTSVLVFTRTKHYADRLAQKLEQAGFSLSVLHGDRSQGQRLRALERFRQGRAQVMVATDVAARGLDVEDISHVINYDIPEVPETYVHRIGRTARAEATGDAFSLMDHSEEPFIAAIERVLNRPLPRVTLPGFDYKKSAPPHRPHDTHAPHRPGRFQPSSRGPRRRH